MDTEPPQMGVIGRYGLLVFIWSTTPLAVVFSVQELHPIWALACRFWLAAPLSALCLWFVGERLPLHRAALRSYVAGMFSLLGAMLCTYLGAVYLPSALISLLFGLSPLFVGLLAHGVFRSQRLVWGQWFGLMLAFAGLVFIFRDGMQGHIEVKGILWVLMGVLNYVVSVFLLQREKAGLHPLAQTTGSLMLSAIGILPILPFFAAFRPTALPSNVTIIAMLYSVIMASVVAMLCYFFLVKRLPPATVSLTTVLTPALALYWGAWLHHEQFTQTMVLGMIIILLGLACYFVQDWRKPAQG